MTSAFSLPSDRHGPYSVIDITEMRIHLNSSGFLYSA